MNYLMVELVSEAQCMNSWIEASSTNLKMCLHDSLKNNIDQTFELNLSVDFIRHDKPLKTIQKGLIKTRKPVKLMVDMLLKVHDNA